MVKNNFLKPPDTSYLKQIQLQERIITYKTVFSKKAKYLRLRINHLNELEVIIPRRYKHEKVEDFINQKKEWILKHLREQQVSKYFYLGEEISVAINYDLFLKKPKIHFHKNRLLANIPSGYFYTWEDIYNVWLKHNAGQFISLRAKELSGKTGFGFNKITIRSQKTRWGSCSTNGILSFNYRLMRFRKDVIDYVIIHELCHLKEMNHSKKFWKLVELFCPDYKELKKELRK